MLRAAYTVLFLSSLVSFAAAQGEAGLPKCAQQCVGNSLGQTGCQTTDVKCICNSSGYIQNLSCCVVGQCSPQDIQNTINFANQICGLQGVTNLPKSATCASSSEMATMSTAANDGPGGASSTPMSGAMATVTTGAVGSGNTTSLAGENMMSGGSSATMTVPSGSSEATAGATGAAGRDFVGLGAAAVAGAAGIGALVL